MTHASHKASSHWFSRSSEHDQSTHAIRVTHKAHKADKTNRADRTYKATNARTANNAYNTLWQRSKGRHAKGEVAVKPTLIADATGLIAATALALVGLAGTNRSANGVKQSFTPLASAASTSSRSTSRSSRGSWSLASAGEFDALRAFSPTDTTKIHQTVKELQIQPVVDSNGRSQYLGISAHQGSVHSDFNNYSFSECTWWAAVRRAELGHPVPDNMGNGGQWADSGRAHHMRVDHTPQVGAVIVFAPGQASADAYYGHVGVVEALLSDGSVIISESSASYNGQIHARRIFNATRYEYVH